MSIKELSNGKNINLGSMYLPLSKIIFCFQIKKNMAENSISWKICSTWTPNGPQFEFSELSHNFEGCHLAVRRCNWSKAANCYSLFLTTGQRSLSSQWGKLHNILLSHSDMKLRIPFESCMESPSLPINIRNMCAFHFLKIENNFFGKKKSPKWLEIAKLLELKKFMK